MASLQATEPDDEGDILARQSFHDSAMQLARRIAHGVVCEIQPGGSNPYHSMRAAHAVMSVPVSDAWRLAREVGLTMNQKSFTQMLKEPDGFFSPEELEDSRLGGGPLYFVDPAGRIAGNRPQKRIGVLTFARLVRLLRKRKKMNPPGAAGFRTHILRIQQMEESLARKVRTATLGMSTAPLSASEELRLMKIYKFGSRLESAVARARILMANQRLVRNIASRCMGQRVSFEDLVMTGNIGLNRALERFRLDLINPASGRPHKFSTFSTWHIKQAMQREISRQGRGIRLPAHVCEKLEKIADVSSSLSMSFGREPTVEEIAKEAEIPVEKVREVLQYQEKEALISLDTPIAEDGTDSIGDLVGEPGDELRKINQIVLHENLEKAFKYAGLSEREREVLSLRFGLEGGVALTLEAVGDEYELTRERIRQIELKALKKIRACPKARALLKDFLQDI